LKQRFDAVFLEEHDDVEVYFPQPALTTDNSIMIALAGHAKKDRALTPSSATTIAASGNLSIATE
jgi:tRNA A37 threonylcarbamoyltransferase TsaD